MKNTREDIGAARDPTQSNISEDARQLARMRELILSCAARLGDGHAPKMCTDGLLPENAQVLTRLAASATNVSHKLVSLAEGLDTLESGLAICDSDLRLLYASKRLRLFFAPVLALQPGIKIADIVASLADPRLWHLPQCQIEVLKRQIAEADGLPRDLHLPDGRCYRWLIKHDENGYLLYLVTDVTAEIRHRQELEEARARAEESMHVRSRFLAHMSHELRTPLNGVLGMAELLGQSGLTPEQHRLAATIRNSAEALLSIINDVLDEARDQSNLSPRMHTPFSLEALAVEVMTLLAPKAVTKGLDLRLNFEPLTPARYIGDPGWVRQVLLNLTGNAIKYTASGRVVMRVIQARNGVDIVVEDTGPGIADDQIDSIFGEYVRLQGDLTDKQGGTGLGLSITSRLVSSMGGRLWVLSTEGQGSSFGVFLPLTAIHDSISRMRRVSRSKPPSHPYLMYICSRRQVWRRVRNIIGGSQLNILFCADLAEVRHTLAENGKPALILYDDDGDVGRTIELRRELAGLMADIPCWLMTTVTMALPAGHGFQRVVTTPVIRADLVASILDEVHRSAPAPNTMARVLAVDDNKTNQLVIEKMLAKARIEVRTASNGEDALRLWREWQPDMILMDIQMPGLDGRQATLKIRAAEAELRCRPCPIIAVTANDESEDHARLLTAGVNDVLAKPVRQAQLLAVVRRFVPGSIDAEDRDATSVLSEP